MPDVLPYESGGGTPRRRPPGPWRNSDVGGSHIALHVRDVDAAAGYLAAHGCTVLGQPETIHEGPLAGDRWVYTRAPFGLYVEVVNMPDGALPYERSTAARRRSAHGLSWTDRVPPPPVRGTVPGSSGPAILHRFAMQAHR
ncbi:hypothetical protein [Streptomyces sp. NPDC029554]|uniref:hypothetical protein n=1 Tax=Streptomyces sp. NPDC029554 TaxID=3155126 RepID=UPI0033E549DF